MATEAQIKANRKNAQKSTGPRTEEGKEAVSQNATRHGLCSCKNVIKSESQEEYNLFHDEMIEDLAPAGAVEFMLAERVVNLSWRLKRTEIFQNVLMDALMDFGLNDMVFGWSDKGLERARSQAQEGNIDTMLGIVIHKDFANSKILEQVLVYEKRIESSLYKATAELRKVQKLRQKEIAWAEAHPTNVTDSAKQAQFRREDNIENNEDCLGNFQSALNDIENENDLKKQSQFTCLGQETLKTQSEILNPVLSTINACEQTKPIPIAEASEDKINTKN